MTTKRELKERIRQLELVIKPRGCERSDGLPLGSGDIREQTTRRERRDADFNRGIWRV